MINRAILASCFVLLTACSEEQLLQRSAEYSRWLARTEKTVDVDAAELDGIWARKRLVYLYKDGFDPKFNSVRSVDVKNSGHWLFFHNGLVAREEVSMRCRDEKNEPKWILESEATNSVTEFLASADPAEKHWYPVKFEGGALDTERPLRGGPAPKQASGARSKPRKPPYAMRLLSQSENEIQLAYVTPGMDTGVHTVVEQFERLTDEKLASRLEKARKAKPCPKRQPTAPGFTPPPGQAPGLPGI